MVRGQKLTSKQLHEASNCPLYAGDAIKSGLKFRMGLFFESRTPPVTVSDSNSPTVPDGEELHMTRV